MPQVGNKKFPYTDAGMKAAKDAAKQAADMKKNAAKGSGNSKATTLPAKPGKTKKKM